MGLETGTLGFNIRLTESFEQLIQDATELELECLQFFLLKPKKSDYIRLTAKDKLLFNDYVKKFKPLVFIHSSYWINPAAYKKDAFAASRKMLKKEIKMAQALGIKYLVLHPGSSKGFVATEADPQAKKQGLTKLAKMLDSVLKNVDDVMILLENTGHGNRTLGNSLDDFKFLLETIKQPEKIGFCFDTAHAFVYGYELGNISKIIKTLDETIGLKKLKLIHFNDAGKPCGSKVDLHAFPGEGLIGAETLRNFFNHPKIKSIPKIIEGPASNKQIMLGVINTLRSWS